MPQATNASISFYPPLLNDLMPKFGIDTPTRIAAFLAQVAHESGQFRYNKEIWGPTSAQKGYEGRKDLGNTMPGDGKKYAGAGLIQLTGRSNYKKFGDDVGIDFVSNPQLVQTPEYATMAACWFWQKNNLNKYADIGDFINLTKRINGGLTNYQDRVDFWERAKKQLK